MWYFADPEVAFRTKYAFEYRIIDPDTMITLGALGFAHREHQRLTELLHRRQLNRYEWRQLKFCEQQLRFRQRWQRATAAVEGMLAVVSQRHDYQRRMIRERIERSIRVAVAGLDRGTCRNRDG